MKKAAFGLALLLVLPSVHAARIVSDPYPPTGNQPDQCGYTEGTGAPVLTPVETVTGGKRCDITVSTFSTGSHSLSIFARSAVWGDSPPVPFSFTAGVPTSPSNLRLIP